LQAKLVPEADLKKYNMLLLIPDENFAKQFVQAKITFGRSQNPSEATYKEIAEARDSSGDQECSAYEDKLKSTQCQSAIEEAREKAMKQAMPTTDTGDGVVSGLVNKNAFYCKIDLGSGGKGEVHAPADGQLRVVMKWSADAKKIDTTNTSQIITSVGSVGSADSFSEIRVNVDNVTSSEDQFGFPVKNIQTTPNITCGHQSSATYTFAGEPQGISLSPSNGLSDISITVGNDGFTTTLTYNTRAPKPPKANSIMRTANSQLNRASFNAN
jgi:hypothetical protein